MVYKQKKTFTLIEMLIVVVIIGILAAALIPRLQSVQARARDTKRKADLHQIATALAIYKEDAGNYKDLHANRRCEDSYVITDTKHITNEYRTPT
ncbi:MAG: prepilin-type N-terminal cleavage/methylation domain-containing protein [bacterium]